MSVGSPVNDYGVIANLSVATTSLSSANTAAATAIADINTALKTLAENGSLSFGAEGGVYQGAEQEGATGTFNLQGQLTIGATATSSAQEVAEDALAAVATAISGVSPAVTVTLQEEQGQFIFEQL